MPGRSRGLRSKTKFTGGEDLASENKEILNRLSKVYKDLNKKENKIQEVENYQRWKDKEVIKQGWQANPSEAKIQIRNLVKEFITKSIPYVVLMLFLVCLYLLFTGGFTSSSSRGSNSNSVADAEENAEIIKNQFSGWFGSIYLFFYNIWNGMTLPPKIKMLLNSYSQYENGGPVLPRTLIDSGRCDNIQWIETTGDGENGTCTSAIRPQDLTWKLNPQLNSEFYPNSAFLTYAKNNNIPITQWTNNTNVIIPWDRSPETTFFVPQCEEAYFANQCRSVLNSDSCEKNEHWANGYCCIKANLLKEQGLTCGLASFNLGNINNDKKNFDKNTTISPIFENINKINQKSVPLDPTGSPLFVNISKSTASGAATTFLGPR